MTSLDEQKRNFEVKGPLKKINLKDVHAFKSDDEVFGQYQRLRDIKGDSGISCYKVIRRHDGFSVGFIGISKSDEIFCKDAVAHVCIEYVYLRPSFRGGQLTELLYDTFANDVFVWLGMVQKRLPDSHVLSVQSSSTPTSPGGAKFVQLTNESMRRYCKYANIKFHASGE
jgi:hypothetical protein